MDRCFRSDALERMDKGSLHGARQRRKWRGSTYEIHVTNPDGAEKGVRSILADGKPVRMLPVLPAGSICRAEVVMGKERKL